ncbi:MAG: sulfurtransferase TusA family protein, partial [Candidatus Limnocylindrales bacterium]
SSIHEPKESAMSDVHTTVDAKGLSCPMPIVKTAQAVKTVPAGELIEVLATDPGSVKDFAAWTRSTGNAIVEQTEADGVYRFLIKRA